MTDAVRVPQRTGKVYIVLVVLMPICSTEIQLKRNTNFTYIIPSYFTLCLAFRFDLHALTYLSAT